MGGAKGKMGLIPKCDPKPTGDATTDENQVSRNQSKLAVGD